MGKNKQKKLGPSFDATLDQVLTQKNPNLGPSFFDSTAYIYISIRVSVSVSVFSLSFSLSITLSLGCVFPLAKCINQELDRQFDRFSAGKTHSEKCIQLS